MSVVGMAWYSPEAWQRLAAIPEARIQKSCAEFLHSFAAAEREFAAQSLAVEKVAVDIDAMLAWCYRRGYQIDDDQGRAVYGACLLMARNEPTALDAPITDNTLVLQ